LKESAGNRGVNGWGKLPRDLKATDPAVVLATGFGLGLLPKAPGTWASLAALPPAWAMSHAFGRPGLALALVALVALGVWCADTVTRRSETPDPQIVVIDEIAGQWLTVLAVPPDAALYAIGFVLFRLFDIWKPWPVSWAERAFKGGLGVMVDDLLAGVYAGALLFAIALTWKG
jgi:phosphatidylglycerophosphatase A